ncbi:DinB family protein [Halobacillus litoralis]|uniref:DinB family protein n=1 Tax=Halobacillus litoralis TaxID=45668 RepID=UPI001CD6E096|nr:DinB family protein [Halobacillus litoralis]MCA0971971.1 DinB family protein [Halobacillus litoralis]
MRQWVLEQFAAIYDRDQYFACFLTAVDQLNDYEAHFKAEVGQANSIAEIIHHLDFYNDRFLSRFRGEEVASLPSSYNTFILEHKDWRRMVKEADQTYRQFRNSLRTCSDEKLQKWTADLGQLWLHNAYHIGQIVHVRKEFGAWSKRAVVKG